VLEVIHILIVATSARMLAHTTNQSGYIPVVIDCFTDIDTQSFSLECIKVNSLSLKSLTPAILLLQKKYSLTHVVYGSGFEHHLDSLAFLEKHFIVLGNSLSTFSSIQNTRLFFSKLQQLNIPHPDVIFQPTKPNRNGLIKPIQGEGGLGIKSFIKNTKIPDQYYWQQYITGTPMSALFIANNTEAKIYGFHKQWLSKIKDQHFIFSGVMSQPELNPELTKKIHNWINALVNEFSLQGINSLDFILNNQGCYVLEINARPSASMQLYQTNLFSEQVDSTLKGIIMPREIQTDYHGYKIVYSESKIMVNKHIKWPSWIVDIPTIGSTIHTGMPICSIIARGENETDLLNKIQSKQQLIKKLLQ
jgi:methenyltetrahydromethanopterin cyclohydrolase